MLITIQQFVNSSPNIKTYEKNIFIGVCTLDYYQNAIAYIKSIVDSPVFYIFSDDIDFVSNYFKDYNSISKFINLNQGENSPIIF